MMTRRGTRRVPGRIVLLLLAASLAGCGDTIQPLSGNCGEQMNDFRAEHGDPQEVERRESGSYMQHTWWYWRLGLARTFTWDGSPRSCEITDRTFPPSEERPETLPAL